MCLDGWEVKLGKEKDSYTCVELMSKGKMNKYKSQKKEKGSGRKREQWQYYFK